MYRLYRYTVYHEHERTVARRAHDTPRTLSERIPAKRMNGRKGRGKKKTQFDL